MRVRGRGSTGAKSYRYRRTTATTDQVPRPRQKPVRSERREREKREREREERERWEREEWRKRDWGCEKSFLVIEHVYSTCVYKHNV